MSLRRTVNESKLSKGAGGFTMKNSTLRRAMGTSDSFMSLGRKQNQRTSPLKNGSLSPTSRLDLSLNDSLPSMGSPKQGEGQSQAVNQMRATSESSKFSFSLKFQKKIYSPSRGHTFKTMNSSLRRGSPLAV